MSHFFIYLFPIFLGVILVIQNGLNDKAQNDIGILWTVLYNNMVFLFLSVLFLFLFYNTNILPSELKAKDLKFKYWYLIPGLFGAIFVTGNVISFGKIGAAKTIIFIICAQVVTSILWDYFQGDKQISFSKILGAILVMIGSGLYALKK